MGGGGPRFRLLFFVIIFYSGERGSVPIFFAGYTRPASETFRLQADDGVIFKGGGVWTPYLPFGSAHVLIWFCYCLSFILRQHVIMCYNMDEVVNCIVTVDSLVGRSQVYLIFFHFTFEAFLLCKLNSFPRYWTDAQCANETICSVCTRSQFYDIFSD